VKEFLCVGVLGFREQGDGADTFGFVAVGFRFDLENLCIGAPDGS